MVRTEKVVVGESGWRAWRGGPPRESELSAVCGTSPASATGLPGELHLSRSLPRRSSSPPATSRASSASVASRPSSRASSTSAAGLSGVLCLRRQPPDPPPPPRERSPPLPPDRLDELRLHCQSPSELLLSRPPSATRSACSSIASRPSVCAQERLRDREGLG